MDDAGDAKHWEVRTLLAASTAGLAADSIMYPADALSTHRQARRVPQGLSSLYRGFFAAAFLGAPAYATYMGTYDYLREAHDVHPSLAGAMAEMVGALIFVPTEVLKRRAALGWPGYRPMELPSTVGRMLREEGMRALYSGYLASSATWVPFSALYFSTFEFARRSLPDWPLRDLTAGAIGGGLAAAATAPIDLVATRVQTRHQGARGVRDVLRGVRLEKAGIIPTLFRAAPARVLWLAPNTAIYMAVFQHLKKGIKSSS